MFCKILSLLSIIGGVICTCFYFTQERCIKGNYSIDNSTKWNWEDYPQECELLGTGSLFLFFFFLVFACSDIAIESNKPR